jgi:hypothetical protein
MSYRIIYTKQNVNGTFIHADVFTSATQAHETAQRQQQIEAGGRNAWADYTVEWTVPNNLNRYHVKRFEMDPPTATFVSIDDAEAETFRLNNPAHLHGATPFKIWDSTADKTNATAPQQHYYHTEDKQDPDMFKIPDKVTFVRDGDRTPYSFSGWPHKTKYQVQSRLWDETWSNKNTWFVEGKSSDKDIAIKAARRYASTMPNKRFRVVGIPTQPEPETIWEQPEPKRYFVNIYPNNIGDARPTLADAHQSSGAHKLSVVELEIDSTGHVTVIAHHSPKESTAYSAVDDINDMLGRK